MIIWLSYDFSGIIASRFSRPHFGASKSKIFHHLKFLGRVGQDLASVERKSKGHILDVQSVQKSCKITVPFLWLTQYRSSPLLLWFYWILEIILHVCSHGCACQSGRLQLLHWWPYTWPLCVWIHGILRKFSLSHTQSDKAGICTAASVIPCHPQLTPKAMQMHSLCCYLK